MVRRGQRRGGIVRGPMRRGWTQRRNFQKAQHGKRSRPSTRILARADLLHSLMEPSQAPLRFVCYCQQPLWASMVAVPGAQVATILISLHYQHAQ